MRKIYLSAILIISGICIFCLAVQYYHVINNHKKIIDRLNDYSDKSLIFSSIKNNRVHEQEINGTKLNGETIIYDSKNNAHKLTDVITDNVLILRYSETHCSSCIEQQIDILKKCNDSLSISNVILLGTHQDFIQMRRYLKHFQIPYQTYLITEELSAKIKDIGAPYYFILNEKYLRINNTFVPLKEFSTATFKYLHDVKQKYFSDN